MTKKHLSGISCFALMAVIFLLVACHRSTYHVKDNEYLLTNNDIVVDGDDQFIYDMEEVIRQKPNLKFVLRFRLMAYNAIDSAKVQHKHDKKIAKYIRKTDKKERKAHEKNEKRIKEAQEELPKQLPGILKYNQKEREKAVKINQKRHKKLAKRYKKYEANVKKYSERKKRRKQTKFKKYRDYVPKLKDTVPMVKLKDTKLRDTLSVKPSLRERLKYKYGEAPVIIDTAKMNASVTQLKAFLKSKGYYNGSAKAHIEPKGKKKAVVVYEVTTGLRDSIDTVIIECSNPVVKSQFERYIRKMEDSKDLNLLLRKAFPKDAKDRESIIFPFDANVLDGYRYEVAAYMVNEKFYDFTEQNIYFKVDTTRKNNPIDHHMRLTIGFSDRVLTSEDGSTKTVPFEETMIDGVYFHILDTAYSLNYRERVKSRGLKLKENEVATLDTFYYHKILKKVEIPDSGGKYYKSSVNKNLFGKYKDSIAEDNFRKAYFLYNGELTYNPALLECQNYLEYTNYYKEYYIDRSSTRMSQLGLFNSVKMRLVETYPGSGKLTMHYYLVPTVRRSFSIQPRATNVNGFLGIGVSANYSDINLNRKGTKLNFTLGMGFEQNSTIIDEPDEPFFNTIEIGPALKLEIPGLYPMPLTALGGKRNRPRTEISAALNYQDRQDFERTLVQFNYMWKFALGDGKTQEISFFPIFPVVKVIAIDKSPEFDQRINELNDLFLKNAYNNQLIWEDFRINYSYDNLNKNDETRKVRLVVNATGVVAGCGASRGFAGIEPKYDAQGHQLLFGIPYSQFWQLDTKFIANIRFSKTKSLAFRALGGVGKPFGNTNTSMPYDYSFSSGGANDVRAWKARQLGPGSYLYLLDPNAVQTQIGDIRMEGSAEFRFGSGLINHAFFVDAGNCWTQKEDPLRPGSEFKNATWHKQIALGAGYGLRLDFEFFILRIDMGVPIFNPTLPDGSRWVYEKRKAYMDKATEIYGDDFKTDLKKHQLAPFQPNFNIGIGLPF